MNAAAHRIGAAATVGLAAACHEASKGKRSGMPLAAAGTAAICGTLPDLLEPAFNNPHHRQFFHSIAFLSALGYGVHRVYKWQPDTEWKKAARWLLLVAGGAYMTHLAMDALTSRGLPLVGKLG